jgi:hypothetical protein
MPKIKVNSNRLYELSNKARNIKNKTNECQASVGTVINRLDWEVSSKASINTRLNRVQKRLQSQTELMDAYAKVLATTNESFCNKDTKLKQDAKKIIYEMNSITANIAVLASAKHKTSYKTDDKLNKIQKVSDLFGVKIISTTGKLLWETVKGAGFIGGFFSIGEGLMKLEKSIISGEGIGKIAAGAAKSGIKITKVLTDISKDAKKVGKIARAVGEKNAKAMWRDRLFGFVKEKTSEATKWSSRFSRNFNKKITDQIDTFKGVKGSAKAALAWAGVVADGVFNWYDNKEEQERDGISDERVLQETIVETAVDTAKTVVIGAAVAAFMPASAPVLAVAAGAALINVGLDTTAKAIFGENYDFNEVVSDSALATGQYIIDLATKPKATLEKTGKVIQEGFNKIVNCFSNPFGKPKAAWAGFW